MIGAQAFDNPLPNKENLNHNNEQNYYQQVLDPPPAQDPKPDLRGIYPGAQSRNNELGSSNSTNDFRELPGYSATENFIQNKLISTQTSIPNSMMSSNFQKRDMVQKMLEQRRNDKF